MPQNPSTGFDVTVTRVFKKDGREVRREKFRTKYAPADDIWCRTPPPGTQVDVVQGGTDEDADAAEAAADGEGAQR